MKKLLATVLLSCVGSTLAYANDVWLVNNTSSVGTAMYKSEDGDFCSTMLGKEVGKGIIGANGGRMPIFDQVLKNNCYFNDCIADVYLSDNCRGNKVATIVLHYNSGGIKRIDNLKPEKYLVNYTATEASIAEIG